MDTINWKAENRYPRRSICMSTFLNTVISEIGNEYASVVSDGVSTDDVSSFVDTGSYIFNALVSGSIFGGIPSNKITAIAGESSTGKTFTLSVVRHFLDTDPDAESFILNLSQHYLKI